MAIKQQLKMGTQAHPSHLYVRNKSPKATQGVMNPRVSALLAPSVSGVWTTEWEGERMKHRQIYSKGALHPFKLGTTILPFRGLGLHVVTSHLSTPGEARPFRAPALPRSFDYINTLICTYYVPSARSERSRVFCLSAFACSSFCDGSCPCCVEMLWKHVTFEWCHGNSWVGVGVQSVKVCF